MSIPEIIKTKYASNGLIKKYLLFYKHRYKTANIFNSVLPVGCCNFNFSKLLLFENLIAFIFFPLHYLTCFNEVKKV